jgi:carbamate kinase
VATRCSVGGPLVRPVGVRVRLHFRTLGNEFRRRGIDRQAVAIVTQTLVDRDDPAFAAPTKPIGSHMAEARAKQLATQYGWTVREDAGRITTTSTSARQIQLGVKFVW